jgi:hypothetical protein
MTKIDHLKKSNLFARIILDFPVKHLVVPHLDESYRRYENSHIETLTVNSLTIRLELFIAVLRNLGSLKCGEIVVTSVNKPQIDNEIAVSSVQDYWNMSDKDAGVYKFTRK